MKIYFFIFLMLVLFLILNFDEISKTSYIDSDDEVLIDVEYKKCKHLLKKSKYQKIDVYNHSELGNILVIDDDLQITENDEKNYHEMIVHVPLNYIPDAENVLIIGGGDGGTLYQVLKHTNIKNIYNIEIDIEVINASKKYFPIIGNSFNNNRVNLIIEDANLWVKKASENEEFKNKFDLIILDITDFGSSDSLINNNFNINLNKLLDKKGIISFNFSSIGWYYFDKEEIKDTDELNLYKHKYIYQVYQPTYMSGHYSFGFLSNYIDPLNHIIDWQKFYDKSIQTKYYNKEIHYSSFKLPNKFLDNKKEILGVLVAINIEGCNPQELESLENIHNLFNEILNQFNLTELKRTHNKFEPYGLTVLSLLSESHLSIHTWPEKNSAFIDIFTCGNFKYSESNIQILENIIKKYLKFKKISFTQVDREINKN